MIFRFGAFELDEGAGELRRGGVSVDVQPKPLALLTLLIRERDRVVSQRELFEALWPGTAVTPASLTRAISHARRAIGDTHRGALLRSVPRRGYRFAGAVTEVGGTTPAADAAPTTDPSDCDWFVGRAGSLATLRDALERTFAGRGGVALISGPAGIGKTRLMEIFGAEAAASGGLVVTGRCQEGDGAPAFWIWAQILRGLIAEDALGDEMREIAQAGELTDLIPEFGPLADAGVQRDTRELSAERRRFRFFDAVTRALGACSRRQPLVLLLEDVQWATTASLRLFEHLAFELDSHPILVVATIRDEPRPRRQPVDRLVGLLRQRAGSSDVALGALSRADVAELLRAVIGRTPPADLTSELFARTEGVPLFVREAIRLLDQRGDLEHPERLARRGVTLPGQAGELIGRSLESLSEGCATLLGAAAVLGRSFVLADVAAIASITRSEALDLFDEAVAAGVIEEALDAPASYRFAHAMFREAIYETLPGGVRARLHLRAAERLESQHPDDRIRVIAELAHHHFEAIAVGDPEHAFECALQAAEEATRLSAHEQAATHLEQAVTALDHCDAVDPTRRLETLLALGDARGLSGEREGRRQAFRQAMDRARALARARDYARAAIGYCALSEWSPRDAFAKRVLGEALDALPDSDLVERAGLMMRLAYLAIPVSPSLAEPDGREAVRLARASGDPEALQEALYILHYALAGPDRFRERRELVEELTEAAQHGPLRDTCVIALLDTACDALTQGDLGTAIEMRRRVRNLSGEYPSPSMVWHTRVYDSGVALMQGRFAEAESSSTEALHLGQRIEHPFAFACYQGQMMQIQRDRGEIHNVQKMFAAAFDTRKGPTHWVRAVLGRAELALGNEKRAREILELLVEDGLENIVRGIRFVSSIVEMALLCAELESESHAGAFHEVLRSIEGLHAVLPVPVNYGGPVALGLARISETLGRSRDAAQYFAEAFAASRQLGAAPTATRIGVEWARLLARQGERSAARELASESQHHAQALDMRAVAEQADQLRKRL